MTDRETHIRATVLQLSRIVAALENSRRTVLPQNPRHIDMISRLCAKLRDLLGVEFDGLPLPGSESSSPPILALPNVGTAPTSIAGKE